MKKTRFLTFVLFVLIAFLLSGTAYADKIVLKNKNTIIGKIIRSDEKELELRVPFGSVTISKQEIKEIIRETDTESELGLIREMMRLGAYDGAISELRRTRKDFPEHLEFDALLGEALIERAKHLLKLRHNPPAERDLDEASKLTPAKPLLKELYDALNKIRQESKKKIEEARAALNQQKPLKAIRKFDDALELTPESYGELQKDIGKAYLAAAEQKFEQKKFQHAALLYEKAAAHTPEIFDSIKPRWLESQLRYASLLIHQGEFETAQSVLDMMNEIAPDDNLVIYLLGTMYYRQFEFRSAYEEFARALGEKAPYSGNPEDTQLLDERLSRRWEAEWQRLRNPKDEKDRLKENGGDRQKSSRGIFVVTHKCDFAAERFLELLPMHLGRIRGILDPHPQIEWNGIIGIYLSGKNTAPKLYSKKESGSAPADIKKIFDEDEAEFVLQLDLESYKTPHVFSRMLAKIVFLKSLERAHQKHNLPEKFIDGLCMTADPKYMRENIIIRTNYLIKSGELTNIGGVFGFSAPGDGREREASLEYAAAQFLLSLGSKDDFYRFVSATAHNETIDAARQVYNTNNWVSFTQLWAKQVQKKAENE